MKYILVIILLIPIITFSQTFKVEKVNGKVKILSNGSEQWQDLKQNSEISGNSIISTDISLNEFLNSIVNYLN